MVDYKDMGRRIRALRKKQGITQAELALKCDISTSFMGHIERGSRIASLETLMAIANVFDVSLEALVKGMDLSSYSSESMSLKMRILNDIMYVLNKYSDEWLRDH